MSTDLINVESLWGPLRNHTWEAPTHFAFAECFYDLRVTRHELDVFLCFVLSFPLRLVYCRVQAFRLRPQILSFFLFCFFCNKRQTFIRQFNVADLFDVPFRKIRDGEREKDWSKARKLIIKQSFPFT